MAVNQIVAVMTIPVDCEDGGQTVYVGSTVSLDVTVVDSELDAENPDRDLSVTVDEIDLSATVTPYDLDDQSPDVELDSDC